MFGSILRAELPTLDILVKYPRPKGNYFVPGKVNRTLSQSPGH